jgi:hypothetical protein
MVLREYVVTLGISASFTVREETDEAGKVVLHASAWSVEGVADQLMAILEGYTRLKTAAAAAAAGQGGALPADREFYQPHWSTSLVGGSTAVLQITKSAKTAGADFEWGIVSFLCSLLRLVKSPIRQQEVSGMYQVVVSVLKRAMSLLESLPLPDASGSAAARLLAQSGIAAVTAGAGPGAVESGPGVVEGVLSDPEGGPGAAERGPDAVERGPGDVVGPGAADVLRKLPVWCCLAAAAHCWLTPLRSWIL